MNDKQDYHVNVFKYPENFQQWSKVNSITHFNLIKNETTINTDIANEYTHYPCAFINFSNSNFYRRETQTAGTRYGWNTLPSVENISEYCQSFCKPIFSEIE